MVSSRCTHSLNLRLWIFMMTAGRRSGPGGKGTVPAEVAEGTAVTGLCTPELYGLPGDSGDMLIGDVWLMGDMSALIGVHDPVGSRLDVFEELSPETANKPAFQLLVSLSSSAELDKDSTFIPHTDSSLRKAKQSFQDGQRSFSRRFCLILRKAELNKYTLTQRKGRAPLPSHVLPNQGGGQLCVGVVSLCVWGGV